MLCTALIPISLHGSRVEAGEEVEVTAEEFANLRDVLTPVDGVVPETPSEEGGEEKPFNEMTLDELRRKAEELGLSKGGSKADLVERITLHQQETPSEEGGEA